MKATNIPKQLQRAEFAFILLCPGQKYPSESGWRKDKIYRCHLPYFVKAISLNQGVGILCGHGNVVVVDADTQMVADLIKKDLPTGFQTKSPSKKGFGHFYFIVEDLPEDWPRVYLHDPDQPEEKGHLGEVISWGALAVVPPSRHPSGGNYKVVVDKDIPIIKLAELTKVFERYMESNVARTKEGKYIKVDKSNFKSQIDYGVNITDIIDCSRFSRRGDNFVGSHPIHGSTTGFNFTVDAVNNRWHCFRHKSGGGILQWVAVEEGIKQCKDFCRGGV